MSQTQPELAPEEIEKNIKDWTQTEYVKINKYCHAKGYQFKKLEMSKCMTLPPVLGIWYVNTSDKKTNLWVVSGDFPTDIADSKIASNAREAIRHFSMSWHLQAANLENTAGQGKNILSDAETQKKFAQQLTHRAESLYDIFMEDKLWENTDLAS